MVSLSFADDLRQMGIVARNELRKFVRGKKFYVYAALVALVAVLAVGLPYLVHMDINGATAWMSTFVSSVGLLVLLGVTLFAASVLVSEFEERTALVLFTRPIKKASVYIGKFVACFAVTAGLMTVYYLAALAISFAVGGGYPQGTLTSYLLMLTYTFALTGIAVLFSSFIKKAGTAAIMTFIVILLILPLIYVAVAVAMGDGKEAWFALDYASSGISSALNIAAGSTLNAWRDGLVMLVWGLIPALAAYWIFQRREL